MSVARVQNSREKSEILIVPIDIDHYVDFIIAAHRETFQLTFRSDITDEFLKNELALARTYTAHDGDSVIGAFIGNEIAGHAVLETRSRADNMWIGWVHFYYVAPQFRRQGVGLQLVRYSTEYFRALGLKEFRLRVGESNKAAQAFYSGAGFTRVLEGDRISLNSVKEFMMVFDITRNDM